MRLVYKPTIFCVGAKTWVYLIIIGSTITMIHVVVALISSIILQHWRKPQGCNAQLVEVIQVLPNAFEVASVPQTGLRAVYPIGIKPRKWVLFGSTCRKAVGHKHVKHVGIGKSHAFFTFLIARFKLVGYRRFLLSLGKHQGHFARLGFADVEVNQ